MKEGKKRECVKEGEKERLCERGVERECVKEGKRESESV